MDLQGRSAFESELAEAVRALHLDASLRLKQSLELAGTTEGSADSISEACRLLASFDSSASCP
jgi:hypothetical protein